MRKILMLVVMVVLSVVAMAQSTNKISYQAVVRDGQNRLVTNSAVTVQVTIGTYEETFNVTTNANGMVSLLIPDAKQTEFNAIDWSTVTTITTKITVGSDELTNTVPLTAVPYALYASNVDPTILDTLVSVNDLNDTLAYYTTTDQIDTLLGDYATNAHLNDTLAYYTTTDQIDTLLGDYATNAHLNDTLAYYTTTDQIDTLLGDYATNAHLNDTLAYYTTTDQLDTLIGKGMYSLIHPVSKNLVGTISVNDVDTTDIQLPGNPLTLKFKRNGQELINYNAFGGFDYPDVDMSDTSYVIDFKDTITTQAIVKYINATHANAYVNDVDSIFRALRANVDVKNAIMDTIKAVAMRHEQDAIDILLYYISNITPAQMRHILDYITANNAEVVSNFITKLNSVLTPADVNRVISALSTSITSDQVEYLIDAINSSITPAQINHFHDYLDNAAAVPNSAAWQLKKRWHDYIYSVAHE